MDDNFRRKCFKCGLAPCDGSGIKLYRFPNPGPTNILRCEMWAKFCLPDREWHCSELQKKLYSEHRMLCSNHFRKTSFTDFPAKKLNRHAFPEIQSAEAPLPPLEVAGTSDASSFTEPILGLLENVEIQPAEAPLPPLEVAGTSDATSFNEPILGLLENVEVGTKRSLKLENVTLPKRAKTFESSKNDGEKSRPYYKKCRKYLKRLCQLRNTIKKMKSRCALRILSEEDDVKKLGKKISPVFALLLQAQIRNCRRKPKGRRWTEEDKIVALRLYKRSPTCYRLLRRLFCLPEPSSLKKVLGRFNVPPGINDKVLQTLQSYVQNLKPSDNNFILMFDEMSIKKHLIYNKKHDVVDGYQDHGIQGRSKQEAVKALVFMLGGIRKAVKQPLAYYLSGANVTADRLQALIKEVLKGCFKAGLNVSATVCDMGGTNRRAYSLLGANQQRPIIEVEGKELVAIFDAPHLLKCFRNMFMKYDIECKVDITSENAHGTGLAKWSHITLFHELDKANPNFVFAPGLTKDHLDPNTKQKMKVSLAAEVLSHTVASGMYSKVSEGTLPMAAVVTANVVSKIDKLFDLVNSYTPDQRRGKPHATNMSDTSPHAEYFRHMTVFFQTMVFVGCARAPPSLEGWLWTINAIQRLWNNMKAPDVQSLATRRLQQDPLENLFGCIRGNCGSNDNPTTSAFIGGLKTAIMSNMAQISAGNCELDRNMAIIDNYKVLLSPSSQVNVSGASADTETRPIEMAQVSDADFQIPDGEIQACAYVCGFLVKNNPSMKTCEQCRNIFLSDKENIHTFIEEKEYYDTKQCLTYPTRKFVESVEKCAFAINDILNQDASINNIKKTVVGKISDTNFEFLNSCESHKKSNMEYIKSSVFHICVNRFCTLKNRQYAEEASRAALKKKINILKNV